MDTKKVEALSTSLLEAINTLTEAEARKHKYDMTIIATIVDDTDKKNNKYKVDGNKGATFIAYGADPTKLYNKGDSVRITVPNGDYSQVKVIEGYSITSEGTGEDQAARRYNDYSPVHSIPVAKNNDDNNLISYSAEIEYDEQNNIYSEIESTKQAIVSTGINAWSTGISAQNYQTIFTMVLPNTKQYYYFADKGNELTKFQQAVMAGYDRILLDFTIKADGKISTTCSMTMKITAKYYDLADLSNKGKPILDDLYTETYLSNENLSFQNCNTTSILVQLPTINIQHHLITELAIVFRFTDTQTDVPSFVITPSMSCGYAFSNDIPEYYAFTTTPIYYLNKSSEQDTEIRTVYVRHLDVAIDNIINNETELEDDIDYEITRDGQEDEEDKTKIREGLYLYKVRQNRQVEGFKAHIQTEQGEQQTSLSFQNDGTRTNKIGKYVLSAFEDDDKNGSYSLYGQDSKLLEPMNAFQDRFLNFTYLNSANFSERLVNILDDILDITDTNTENDKAIKVKIKDQDIYGTISYHNNKTQGEDTRQYYLRQHPIDKKYYIYYLRFEPTQDKQFNLDELQTAWIKDNLELDTDAEDKSIDQNFGRITAGIYFTINTMAMVNNDISIVTFDLYQAQFCSLKYRIYDTLLPKEASMSINLTINAIDGDELTNKNELFFATSGSQGTNYTISLQLYNTKDKKMCQALPMNTNDLGNYELRLKLYDYNMDEIPLSKIYQIKWYAYKNDKDGKPNNYFSTDKTNISLTNIIEEINKPCVIIVDIQVNKDDEKLQGYYPIAYSKYNKTYKANVVSTVVYDITGKKPIYQKTTNIVRDENGNNTTNNNNTLKLFYYDNNTNTPLLVPVSPKIDPVLKNNILYPLSIANRNRHLYVLKTDDGETWYQTVYITKNLYPTAMDNPEENKTRLSNKINVYSNSVGSLNVNQDASSASGVFMGLLERVDNTALEKETFFQEGNTVSDFGLYGYKNGNLIFGLDDDGDLQIGSSTSPEDLQIHGVAQTANSLVATSGSGSNITTAHLSMGSTSFITDSEYQLYIDNNGTNEYKFGQIQRFYQHPINRTTTAAPIDDNRTKILPSLITSPLVQIDATAASATINSTDNGKLFYVYSTDFDNITATTITLPITTTVPYGMEVEIVKYNTSTAANVILQTSPGNNPQKICGLDNTSGHRVHIEEPYGVAVCKWIEGQWYITGNIEVE